MDNNRPRARKKIVTGNGTGVHNSGSGAGTGPVGSRPSHSYGSGSSIPKRAAGGGGILTILAIIFMLMSNGGLSGLLGGGSGQGTTGLSQMLNAGNAVSSGWYSDANTGKLNTSVASSAREKFTTIKGSGADTVTIMVYLCGTDLESRSGMATKDLNEMLSANISDKVNLIVYTGGCSRWNNNVISNKKNQIYRIRKGGMECLNDNAGTGAMTDPNTLSSFIKWTANKYPANRMDLIFWDHGSGSISGYGYDEKNRMSGSMTLAGIDKALKSSGVKFDFVGFDACLMATAETALMLDNYADYMIASEETEPGIGWYYTNWLNLLSANTSISTLEIGKTIIDDYTSACQRSCPGQSTTLSITDLAELSQSLPTPLNEFSNKAASLIKKGNYKTVANARTGSREFARSSGIDQIDFVHFAKLIDTEESKALANTLLNAVKYNRTSSNMTNSYGLSIYFPYKKLNKVDSVSNTYDQIGMDSSYTSCIKSFAQMQVGAHAMGSGNTSNPMPSLFGESSSSGSELTGQALQTLLTSLFSGAGDLSSLGISGLDRSNTAFLTDEPIDVASTADYLSNNTLSEKDFKWKTVDSQNVISMSEEKWSLVETADMSMFFDDGDGYIDLGLDNIYDFDKHGNLVPSTDNTWLSINGQPVAYYHTETLEKGNDKYQITGYVPVKLNGQRANLILVFDDENEDGYIAGATFEYTADVTEVIAKSLTEINKGDQIEFLADYYDYNKTFKEDIKIGNTFVVSDPANIQISNTDVKGSTKIMYVFKDIYGRTFRTPVL
ncbi:MAG: peptidase C11 [Lachnospiraceae bacterium]|nr:peptidase C11 [Lachnospiraceae bacterium]